MKFISVEKIDIVVGHTPKGGLISMLASFIMRVPIRIYFRHGLVYETSHGLKRQLLIYVDRLASLLATKVVCVSPSVCKKSLENHLNTSDKQILLSKGTCNGIDVERFSKTNIDVKYIARLKDKFQIKENDFIIGFTGRLVKDKGIVELVDAFIRLQDKYKNIVLLLVGMFEERDALPIDTVNLIKNNSSILATGYIENSEIENYYALMDLFVLPSYREGFPTSVLEASSMEIPVITTKATGCIDSIVDKETGVFVDLNDDSLYNALLYFYQNRKDCLKYGKNGRSFVVSNFKQELIWKEISKLYKK